MLDCLKISLDCHYCSDITAVLDVDIGTALTSQQCHMPDIGTLASFELVWYHSIRVQTCLPKTKLTHKIQSQMKQQCHTHLTTYLKKLSTLDLKPSYCIDILINVVSLLQPILQVFPLAETLSTSCMEKLKLRTE